MELLVTIAALAVISGVAVFGVSKFRSTAANTALDQSLSAVATAVEAQMLLEGIDELKDVVPQRLAVRNARGIDFIAFDVTAGTAVVQARFKGTVDPCRQIVFPDTTPGPCDSTAGKKITVITPGYEPDAETMSMVARVQTADERLAKERLSKERLANDERLAKESAKREAENKAAADADAAAKREAENKAAAERLAKERLSKESLTDERLANDERLAEESAKREAEKKAAADADAAAKREAEKKAAADADRARQEITTKSLRRG